MHTVLNRGMYLVVKWPIRFYHTSEPIIQIIYVRIHQRPEWLRSNQQIKYTFKIFLVAGKFAVSPGPRSDLDHRRELFLGATLGTLDSCALEYFGMDLRQTFQADETSGFSPRSQILTRLSLWLSWYVLWQESIGRACSPKTQYSETVARRVHYRTASLNRIIACLR